MPAPSTCDPALIDAMLGQADAALGQGELDQAQAGFEAVLRLSPRQFDALHLLGVVAMLRGDFQQAVHLIQQAIQEEPDDVQALHNLGLCWLERHEPFQALNCFNRACELDRADLGVAVSRGLALMALQRHQEAVGAFDDALALAPDRMDLLANRGNALLKLRRVDEAMASYRQALRHDPRHPDVLSNLAGALREAGRWDEALAQCDLALAAQARHAGALMNRGNVMLDTGRLTQAREDFAQVAALQPANADAYWAQGWAAALQGDWAAALPLFEWRWQKATFTTPTRGFRQPLWLGAAPLQGQTILLHAEQGLGDTIQFCRYAREVKARGARVLLEVQPALKTLISTLDPDVDVLAQGVDALPAFDCHCPMMSLPLAFKATPSTVPAMPAYLYADPQRVHAWGARLGGAVRPRVGLVWSGNAAHRDDHNRSMTLAHMLQALPPGIDLYVLQKDIRDSDLATLQAHPNIVHLSEALQNIDDTAALLTHMDVIVSVDTAIAHLAGALGKPVWILLAKMPDWRWLLIRHDSPWYPSARLFRQVGWGQWDQPLKAIGQCLQDWPG